MPSLVVTVEKAAGMRPSPATTTASDPVPVSFRREKAPYHDRGSRLWVDRDGPLVAGTRIRFRDLAAPLDGRGCGTAAAPVPDKAPVMASIIGASEGARDVLAEQGQWRYCHAAADGSQLMFVTSPATAGSANT